MLTERSHPQAIATALRRELAQLRAEEAKERRFQEQQRTLVRAEQRRGDELSELVKSREEELTRLALTPTTPAPGRRGRP